MFVLSEVGEAPWAHNPPHFVSCVFTLSRAEPAAAPSCQSQPQSISLHHHSHCFSSKKPKNGAHHSASSGAV